MYIVRNWRANIHLHILIFSFYHIEFHMHGNGIKFMMNHEITECVPIFRAIVRCQSRLSLT